jgi:hypothetical protein
MTDSPHLGRARSAPTPFDNPEGNQPSKKRSLEDLEVKSTKRSYRDEGSALAVAEAIGEA